MPQSKTFLGVGLTLVVIAVVGSLTDRLVIEKILTRLALPYGLAWMLVTGLLLAAVRSGSRVRVVVALISWCLIYGGGNGYLAKLLMRSLEQDFVAIDLLGGPVYDTVVVLGGGSSLTESGQPQLGTSGDRIFTAAKLFHAGKAHRIITTGSLISGIDRQGLPQSQIGRELLQQVAVPKEAIQEIGGQTTSGEIVELAQVVNSNERLGVITSAWHLRRVLRLANSQGLHPDPLPADFRSPPDMRPTILDLFPDAASAYSVQLAAKEWLARLVGR